MSFIYFFSGMEADRYVKTWLREANWQQCPTPLNSCDVSNSRCVFDSEMATFAFEEHRIIILLHHLCGMKPIKIHQQLGLTCNDGVMDVKNVRLCVRLFKEGNVLGQGRRDTRLLRS